MEEILELLYKSKLDESGISLQEDDLEAMAEVARKLDNTDVGFEIDRTTDTNLNGIYHLEKNQVIIYLCGIKKTIHRYFDDPEVFAAISKLSREDYEVFIKAISFLTVLHEYDHVMQWTVMRNRDYDNPDFLLLELAQGKFKAEGDPELREFLESKFGPLTGKPLYGGLAGFADMLMNSDENHDLRPFERMAIFNSYKQLLGALKLDYADKSLLVSIIKMMKLKPLVDYYSIYEVPSGYYLSNIGGTIRYGEAFEKNLVKLYKDQPADYRFYTGLSMTKSELKPYKDEIREAEKVVSGRSRH